MKIAFKKIASSVIVIVFCCLFLVGCVVSNGTVSSPNGGLSASSDANSSGGNEESVGYWQDTRNFGIQVKEGVMYLGEDILYEAGVNCYNLFNQCFEDDYSAQKAKQTLDILAQNNIGVVRFNCGGYLSDYINNFYQTKTKYINLLREISEYAESLEIGLIPSFFWLFHAVPDYYDEPIRCWGRDGSQTVAFLQEYTVEIVRALKDYKAIFAWEFGNEFNLSCDLPNAAEHMPALPKNSKRTARTEEDYLSAVDVEFALGRFSESILSVDDTGRMITSGNATLRPSQYHQLYDNSWEQDDVLEFRKITKIFAPDGIDTVSEHVYFASQKVFGEVLTVAEYLQYALANAKNLNKAYFIGEWGWGSDSAQSDYESESFYTSMANVIVDAGVQLSLLWNFNTVEGSVEYSFSADTARGQMLLSVLANMNDRYEAKY